MWNYVKKVFSLVNTSLEAVAEKTLYMIATPILWIWFAIIYSFGRVSSWYKSMKTRAKKIRVHDLRLNPITWNFVFRPTVCVLAGMLVAGLVKILMWTLFLLSFIPYDPVSMSIFISITTLVCIAVIRRDETPEKVPETDYGALVTFMGMVIPIIRTSGDYTWPGKKLLLDRSRKAFLGVTDKNGKALEEGFVPLGDITFQVWDSAHAGDKKARSSLTRPAKNRAPVTGSLTLIGDFPNPRLWLKAVDPALDLGDRARQEYQEMIATIVDTDVDAIQAMMQDYLLGKPLLTTFVTENVNGYKAGAMIRDVTGLVMCKVVQEGEDIENEKLLFADKIRNEADPKMLAILTKGGRPIPVVVLQVSDPLTEVTVERGMNIRRVTFGDVTLSEKVSNAAEQASAESDERNAQLASAKTNKEVRKALQPTPTEMKNPELYQLTTVLAAAADDKNGNIKVTLVPGGDRLSNAIIAAGQSIGGKP